MAEVENRGPEVLAVSILFLVLMWTIVPARCWVRIRMINAFAIDDWLSVASLLVNTGYAILIFIATAEGSGKHEVDLTSKQKVEIMKMWYGGELVYIISVVVARGAVAAFLLRVTVRSVHRWIVWSLTAVNIAFHIYFFFFTIFQCTPVDGFWNRYAGMKGVNCHPTVSVNSTFAASGLGAFIDWVFGLLPVVMLWETNLNAKKKAALGFVMGLGAIASTAPLVRIPYTAALAHTHDFLWETVDISIWSFVEPSLMLVAISLAVLRPLFASLRNRTNNSDPTKYGGRKLEGGERPTNQSNTVYSQHLDELHLQTLPKGHHVVTIEGGYKPHPTHDSKQSGSSFYRQDSDSSEEIISGARHSNQTYNSGDRIMYQQSGFV